MDATQKQTYLTKLNSTELALANTNGPFSLKTNSMYWRSEEPLIKI